MTAVLEPRAVDTAPVRTAPAIVLEHVTRRFGHGSRAITALDDLSLTVAPGEFVCLLGPSGCGKSTVLNLLAGLDQPNEGRSAVAGSPALMFQEPALFPWLTARENVEFPLKLRHVPTRERRRRADELLSLVHLDGFADRRPHELSGGMRQRTALARALAQEGGVLLMDEPFAALDALMRDRLHEELERIWTERRLTVLFVTHNVTEAVRLGDRVLLLSGRPGRLEAEFDVCLPRPRRSDAVEVAALSRVITDRLYSNGGQQAAGVDDAVA